MASIIQNEVKSEQNWKLASISVIAITIILLCLVSVSYLVLGTKVKPKSPTATSNKESSSTSSAQKVGVLTPPAAIITPEPSKSTQQTPPTKTPSPSVSTQQIPPPSTPKPPTNINIIGTADFVNQTNSALTLLNQKDSNGYNQVITYIKTIESVASGSGMYVETKTFKVGNITAFAYSNNDWSVIWYASTIVHDSNHSKLYSEGLQYTGKDAEIACLTIQLTTLKNISAPDFLTSYIQNIIDNPDSNPYWSDPNRYW